MKYWLIWFEDPDHPPEVFTDEGIARKVFDSRRTAWACTLMGEIESARGKYGWTIGEPVSESSPPAERETNCGCGFRCGNDVLERMNQSAPAPNTSGCAGKSSEISNGSK